MRLNVFIGKSVLKITDIISIKMLNIATDNRPGWLQSTLIEVLELRRWVRVKINTETCFINCRQPYWTISRESAAAIISAVFHTFTLTVFVCLCVCVCVCRWWRIFFLLVYTVTRPKSREKNRPINTFVLSIRYISQLIEMLVELSAGFIYQCKAVVEGKWRISCWWKD